MSKKRGDLLRRDEHVVAVRRKAGKQARRYRGMGNSTAGRMANVRSDVDEAGYEIQSVTLDNGETWVPHLPEAASRGEVRQAFESCKRHLDGDEDLRAHVSRLPQGDITTPRVWTKDHLVAELDRAMAEYTREVDATKRRKDTNVSKNEKRRRRRANDRMLEQRLDGLVALSVAHLNPNERHDFALIAASYLRR